jgi:hypothetical protein
MRSVLPGLAPAKQAYLCRQTRSLCYYLVAAPAGIVLAARMISGADADEPVLHRMVHDWCEAYDVLFTMALAHWIVAAGEDARTVTLLGTNVEDVRFSRFLFFGYIVHHAFAIACYGILLTTRRLAVLGVFGLCFELPVIATTAREFLVTYEPELRTVSRSGRTLWWLWIATPLLVCIGRLMPVGTFLWFWWAPSTDEAGDGTTGEGARESPAGEWRRIRLGSLDAWEVNFYYVMGFMFSSLTLYWIATLCCFLDQDVRSYLVTPRRGSPSTRTGLGDAETQPVEV